MINKIEETLVYYYKKREEIIDFVNGKSNLTPDQIIEHGEQMEILEFKITALEIAMDN